MSQEVTSTGQTTTWCCGLPLAAQIPFTKEERTRLHRQYKQLIFRGRLYWAASPFVFIIVPFLFAPLIPKAFLNFVLPVILVGMMVLTGLAVCSAREALRRAKKLHGDLQTGYYLRFEGILPPGVPATNCTVETLLTTYIGQMTSLEILPASGRLWRIHEQPVGPWAEATYRTTANLPEIAGIAAQWLDRVDQKHGKVLETGTRELSLEEQAELSQFAHSVWRRPFWPAVLLTLWVSFPLLYTIITGHLPEGANVILVVVLLAGAITSDIRLYSAVQRARLVIRDASNRRVIIVHVTSVHDDDASPLEHAEGLLFEILPRTKTVWTINGEPAPWRKG